MLSLLLSLGATVQPVCPKLLTLGALEREWRSHVREEMGPGSRQHNRIIMKLPSEPPHITFFSSCWNLAPLCPNVGDILMHWLLGDVRRFSKQDKHDRCLPFWRENIFIKAVYTSYIHPQIFVARVTEQGMSPPAPPPGSAVHRCIHNQVIKHNETKSQSGKRRLPQA